MPDYGQLIDAETWAFIERTNSFYPPDAVELSVATQRAVYDRMCAAFDAGRPDGVAVETTAIATGGSSIAIRIYRPDGQDAASVVLFFHGGGFVVGGLDSHDDVCAELCVRTGFEVVSAGYRLAPEHRHPAMFEDARTTFEWAAARDARPILLCGDSAGGNLAAAVAHATRSHPRAAIGQVLVYPALGGDRSRGSHVRHAEAPMMTAHDLDYYAGIRCAGEPPENDPTYAPLADSDFSRLPPTLVVTAECDPLSSDGETYRDHVLAAGGQAAWIEEPGLVHGYLRARHSAHRAGRSFARIVDAVSALGAGRWLW